MRFLLTTHQFLPDFSAGTEIMALTVARGLIARGHQVQIFTGFPGQSQIQPDDSRFDRYEYEGLTVHRFTHAFVPMAGITNVIQLQHNNPLTAQYFRTILQDFKPDLVHAFHLARLSASLIDVCAQMNIPFIFSAHDFWPVCPTSQLLLPGNCLCTGPNKNSANCLRHLAHDAGHKIFYSLPDAIVGTMAGLIHRGLFPPTPFNASVRALIDRPDFLKSRLNQSAKIIVPSRIMADMLTRNGIDPQKIVHLPNGIDLGTITKTIRNPNTGPLRVGFLGTLAEHKGVQILLQAARRLQTKANVTFAIYGLPGPIPDYVTRIERDAKSLSNVQLFPGFDHATIGQILAGLDVIVVPSLWYENAPLVIFEAQAAGCVVVASNLGGMAEAVSDQKDGMLFPAGDTDALADALTQLAADRQLVSRLSAATVYPLSMNQHIERLLSIYQSAGLDPVKT